ncbi:MAG: hypothetical protein HY318_04020 [Armatimonadetes bacterium]|nr:hypothetical protein [Armatimonadota bacterium]
MTVVQAHALAAPKITPGSTRGRGEFLFFHYSLVTDPQVKEGQFHRLKEFRLLLTNGYETFSPKEVADLHRAGCKLFFYFWFNGFYEWEARQPMPDGDWRREILERHRHWLLNPERPEQGNGAVKPAYFYDFTQAPLRQFLAQVIAEHRRRVEYDGVFLDYAGSYAVPEAALEMHRQKHPETPYDSAGGLFLKTLKESIPELLIFTNQAYRAAEYLLPFTDVDLAESLATSHLWGTEISIMSETREKVQTQETYYRPWTGSHGIKAYYSEILDKVGRYNPSVHFVTINYVRATWKPTLKGDGQVSQANGSSATYRRSPDRAAIYYGYAAARLFGLDSYSSDWYDVGCFDDEVFLVNLGGPKGKGPKEREGLVVRYFDNGFVALTTTARGGVFDVSSHYIPANLRGLWDVYERRSLPGFPKRRTIRVRPMLYPGPGSTYPSGRVYVYVR